MLYSLAKSLLLPPVGLFLLILIALLWWRAQWAGWLILLCTLLLLLLSLPFVSYKLMAPLEPFPALDQTQLDTADAQAIVLLSAGRYSEAPEFGGDSIGPISLQRARYAAWLQRHTRLPLIVTGGSSPQEQPPLGRLIAEVLEQEFQVPVAAVEDRSRNTWENASYTAPILRKMGIGRILLVSSAWHLPRAVRAFERQGLQVTPAPTAFENRTGILQAEDFVPGVHSLQRSYYAIHEYLGSWWYRLRELGE
jgi:uncharacterized SAM-binding protein YcdF (DUF218 family)